MERTKFSRVRAYHFWGWIVAIIGMIFLVHGATEDISVASPVNDYDRIVNTGLMFSALSSQIVGGFIFVAGVLLICTGSMSEPYNKRPPEPLQGDSPAISPDHTS